MKAYKKRMVEEYKKLKERYDKLDALTVKAQAGTLDFQLNCPLNLLLEQKRCMGEYLRCLKIRAEIEGVNINGRLGNAATVHDVKLEAELLPCPFCGGEASKRLFYKGKYRVHCNVCDAYSGDVCDTEAKAIAAWNTRAELESEEKTQGKITFVDTREMLEEDVRRWFADDYYEDYYSEEDMNSVVSEWLDRQAAITKMEMQAEIEKKGL